MTLVEIIKREWGTTWTNAIKELCEVSKSDQNICMNTFKVMKMLSEEVFSSFSNNLTSSKVKELKSKFQEEFISIYDLCD
jgi:hypothetical protein